jgi:hypothetical protein
MNEHFTLRYSLDDKDKNESVMDLEMNFHNPSEEMLIGRLNTWLKAITRKNLEVTLIKSNKKEPIVATTTTTSITTTTLNNNNNKKNEKEVTLVE